MLNAEISQINGVGKYRERHFKRLGLHTAYDMLCYVPRSYEDRSTIKRICDLIDGETVCIKATACTVFKSRRVRRGLSYQKVTVTDNTGVVFITWFNQDYLAKNFDLSAEYIYYGKIAVKNGRVEMNSPVIVKDNKIEPVYPLTSGLTQNIFRKVMENCIGYINQIPESLPARIREKYTLCAIDYAIDNIHFPKSFEKLTHARYRLAFEELFLLQLGLRMLKKRRTVLTAKALCNRANVEGFIKTLPFSLTRAQTGYRRNTVRYAKCKGYEQAGSGRRGERKNNSCRNCYAGRGGQRGTGRHDGAYRNTCTAALPIYSRLFGKNGG